ncbi:MAG: 2-hydroxyglutaryl-CoA dehydratase [Deltaproteobacteria bacterium]|nr:2-hydroxyglutaryl-CoA dehydratase [Deltaproteobacteria bacterium]
MYYLGIDIGSLSCDAVLLGDNGSILAYSVVPTGARNQEAIAWATTQVLDAANLTESDIKAVVSTGYGRDRVARRMAAVTEITCHAKGVQVIFPGTQVLVDIGGQDSKAIRLDGEGRVMEFAMNDKCAAGTGRFLEAMARALQVDITELGGLDLGASGNLTLSSMCTVFAESEVVSLIADGVEICEIVSGLNRAIASRILSLVKRVTPDL